MAGLCRVRDDGLTPPKEALKKRAKKRFSCKYCLVLELGFGPGIVARHGRKLLNLDNLK